MANNDRERGLTGKQALLDALPDLVVRFDRHGTCLEIKPAAGIPLRRKAEHCPGKDLDKVLPPPLARVMVAAIEETGHPYPPVSLASSFEYQDRLYHCEVRVLEDRANGGFLGIIRDIGEPPAEQRYHNSEMRYRALFEHANDAIFLVEDGRFIDCNCRALAMFSCHRQDIIGKTPLDISAPVQPDGTESERAAEQKIRAALDGQSLRFEWRQRRPDGSEFDTEVSLNSIQLDNRTVLQAMIRDITERKQQEQQVSTLTSIMEQTADIVIITDTQGRIQYVNPAFEATTGFQASEVIGKNPNILSSGKHHREFYAHMWNTILAGQPYNNILINRRKDGSLYYEEKTITPVKDQAGNITHLVSTAKDISEHMQVQERLQHIAHHDALTDLPNRNLFLDRLQQALTRARWHHRLVAVIFLDLDRFKNINDTLGHSSGDQLLLQLSERLKHTVRDGDTIARFGGDEFAILLDDIDSDNHISLVAQKILDTLTKPFRINNQELYITASIGISIYPDDGEDSEMLLRNADVAMYRAKDLGKNNYQFYSDDMSARIFERLTLENNLRHALERNEFVIHYQPQVDARNEHITGVEALIRWQHPDLGLVLPSNFIPLLEETGLIEEVGKWALETSCRQLQEWHDAGRDTLHMSVNISSRQFNNPDFVSVVHHIIEETGVNPEFLELELTESMFMRNASSTINALNSLSNLGIRFAIDDFGTGYSSLSYLRRFPIDTIKIDRSFIRDITEDPDDAAIASAIVVMAQSLSLNVIAEGVENAGQLAFLREHNCNYIQGYHYSHPMPAGRITDLLGKLH